MISMRVLTILLLLISISGCKLERQAQQPQKPSRNKTAQQSAKTSTTSQSSQAGDIDDDSESYSESEDGGIIYRPQRTPRTQPMRGEFAGRVVSIQDGDTIEVMHDGRAERIRLAEIDGSVATEFLLYHNLSVSKFSSSIECIQFFNLNYFATQPINHRSLNIEQDNSAATLSSTATDQEDIAS